MGCYQHFTSHTVALTYPFEVLIASHSAMPVSPPGPAQTILALSSTVTMSVCPIFSFCSSVLAFSLILYPCPFFAMACAKALSATDSVGSLCAVCLEEVLDPRLLKFMHSFCRHCMEELSMRTGTKPSSSVRCAGSSLAFPMEGTFLFPRTPRGREAEKVIVICAREKVATEKWK